MATLSILKQPGGTVTVPAYTPGVPLSYPDGTNVTVTVTPAPGYRTQYIIINSVPTINRANRNSIVFPVFGSNVVVPIFEPIANPIDQHFSIFNAAATEEYVVSPQPVEASWEPIQIGESANRMPIYDVYKNVNWKFGGDLKDYMTEAMFGKFISARNSITGYMYFRTADDSNPTQYRLCRGRCLARPGGSRYMGMWMGVGINWWMVEPYAF